MSRVGKRPIQIPDDIEVEIDGQSLTVEGPKGEVNRSFDKTVDFELEDGVLHVNREDDSRKQRSHQGLVRSRIANMITGVDDGFTRTLEINGIGYRAEIRGEYLHMDLGFSHPVLFEIPDSVEIEVEEQKTVHLTSPDRELLGQVAAKLRHLRPPEPYKGKGIKYEDEKIRRKVGKAAGGASASA